MIYISEQIKEALKTLAEIKRRPPYELCIVKSVLNAYRNDEPHCLKAELDVVLEQKFPRLNQPKEIIIVREKPAMATDEQYQEYKEKQRTNYSEVQKGSGSKLRDMFGNIGKIE